MKLRVAEVSRAQGQTVARSSHAVGSVSEGTVLFLGDSLHLSK